MSSAKGPKIASNETPDQLPDEYVVCGGIVNDKSAVCGICGRKDDADTYCDFCGGCILCCDSEEHCTRCGMSGACGCQ
jgi:hypothetical protein